MLEPTVFPEPATSLGAATLGVLVEATSDGILIVGDQGNVLLFSPPAQIIFGYTDEEILGRSVELLIPERYRARHREHFRNARWGDSGTVDMIRELSGQRKNGSEVPLRVSVSRFHHANQVYFLAMIQDVTEDHRAQVEFNYVSRHDALTGLLNRKAFEQRLSELLDDPLGTPMHNALLCIDVDRFTLVNDQCGTAAGDALLKQLSMLVQSRLRKADTLARLGGDELGAIFRGVDTDEVISSAETLLRTVRGFLFIWGPQGIDLSLSVGMSEFSPGLDTPQSVLSAAHLACEMAKEDGGNRLHRYSLEDQDLQRRHGEMRQATDLSAAMDEGRFTLFTQPIVSLTDATDRERYEVLTRMLSPVGQRILPRDFIPAAERYRLMASVDRWIIGRILADKAETIRHWYAVHRSSSDFLYSLNLSGQSLGDNAFLRFLIRQFDDHQVPFEAICFEVTETSAIANLAAARMTLIALRDRGCSTALDDFGNGMSSFRYLKTLPLDYLKIDGHLVRDLGRDRNDFAMVRAINEVGHSLGLRTVAEGVETEETLNQLRNMGVHYTQGFAVGVPTPIDPACRFEP